MSIKDLFGKKTEKVVVAQQKQNIYDDVESAQYIEQLSEKNVKYLPEVDFSNPSNFARYGSAKRYYADSFKNIYSTYPYDGSKKEKLQWRNSATQFDLYLYDNLYPKSTGYVTLGGYSWNSGSVSAITASGAIYKLSSHPQYITLNGGPNTASSGKFADANLYNLTTNRGSNLAFNPSNYGNTVEFWFKEQAENSSSFALFDLWNGVNFTGSNYTRFLIEKVQNNFYLTYKSGSSGVERAQISYTADRFDWHHYAFTVENASSELNVSFYVDGELVTSFTTGSSVEEADNFGTVAYIGAYRTSPLQAFSTASWSGRGSVYGSFDEFRFWKESRESKEIFRNWFTSVDGGSNTDDSNTELGVYYKFNEGINSTSSINNLDSKCLDYSGRITNGTIVNYTVDVRNTGSAIDTFSSEYTEKPDPIVYSSNPSVQQLIEEYEQIGFDYDDRNVSNIYKSLPSWITEEQEKNGTDDLNNLIQIISSYFDTLHIQIENLPKVRQVNYYSSDTKPIPFMNKILSSYGFDNIDIFNDTTVLEELLARNETTEFEANLFDIKNTIYQNIYNNLTYIYKSKGTENSLRNLIRCFGVDDELIKINLYADNVSYDLKDNFKYSAISKKFLDFNDPDRFEGILYQKNISGNSDTKGYIAGDPAGRLDYIPITLQSEIIFPKKIAYDNANYVIPQFSTVSLFGAHTANDDENVLDWGSDEFNIQVFAEKRGFESPDVYFKLSGSLNGSPVVLTSSWYNDTYQNEKWNLAVRIKPNKLENVNLVSGSSTGDYLIEFVGFNSTLDNVDNFFSLSASVSEANAKAALAKNKRIYAGALYTDFYTADAANLVAKSDVKISSVRFWFDYLTDEEIQFHSYDASNFGRKFPYWSVFPFNTTVESPSFTKLDLLALNWNFNLLTTTDGNGEFILEDASSGSVAEANKYGYGWLGNIIKYRHTGLGESFYPDDTQIVNKEYVHSAKLKEPESISNSDLIQIRDTDDITFTRETKPITYFYAVEKSMSQVINSEILNWFATIAAFNNLIGQPDERYRKQYKNLTSLRTLFFEKVQNNPDFERFMELFKWVDSSISLMIKQLIPASANFSDEVRNIIESHMLERNKYENKLPSITARNEINAYTTNPLIYKYEEQRSESGSLWLKNRVERNSPLITSGDANADSNREQIREVIFNKNLNKLPQFYDKDTAENYDGNKDKIRGFSALSPPQVQLIESPQKIINPISIENSPIVSEFQFASASVTSSGQVVQPIRKRGNYSYNYEFVQTSGRTNVNLGLNDIVQALTSSGADRTLPTRPVIKSVFVERFSAPGGPEIMSRGALEQAGEEYSVYNNLNYRNLIVRKNLNKWLAESSSINSTNPSFHKVNKNTAYKLQQSGSNVIATSNYDNEFIVHQIPRSDAQYAWITASVVTKPSSSVYLSQYSNLEPYNSSSLSILSGSLSGASNAPVDFIGLNLNINVDAITGSTYLLTTSSAVDLNTYLLNINGPYQGASWKSIRNSYNKLVRLSRKNNKITVKDETGVVDNFEYTQSPVSINKPLRQVVAVTGSSLPISVVSTYHNNKETFSNQDLITTLNAPERKENQTYEIIKNLEDPNVSSFEPRPKIQGMTYNHYIFPRKQYLGLKDVRTKPNYEDIGNTASVANVRTFWKKDIASRERIAGSKDIFNYLNIDYSAITDFTASFLGNPTASILFVTPNDINESIFSMDSTGTLTASITSATRVSNDVIPTAFKITSSYNTALKGPLAPFSLEEHRYFILKSPFANFDGKRTGVEKDYLEPFTGYNFIEGVKKFSPRPQYIFTNHVPSSIGGGTDFSGGGLFVFDVNRTTLATSVTYNNSSPDLTYIRNDGYIYETDQVAGRGPFFNSYEEFSSDIKSIGFNGSVLPEFKISDLMPFYITGSGGNFYAIPQSSYLTIDSISTENFEEINEKIGSTDLMKFFPNDSNNKINNITINVSAVKKLLPYKGFYPSERVVQLASLFINSFLNLNKKYQITDGTSLTTFDSYLSNGTPIEQQVLTLLQPMFAPGILLNTIKSSLAVDWPLYISSSGDYTGPQPGFYSTGSNSYTGFGLLSSYEKPRFLNTSSTYRLPFESIIDYSIPQELLLQSNNLYYLDPTYYASDVVTGSADRANLCYPNYNLSAKGTVSNGSLKAFTVFRDNLYKYAINNFLAEVPEFFLKNKLATHFSVEQEKFKTMRANVTYSMDVVVQRNERFKEFIADPFYERRKRSLDTFTEGSILQPSPDSLYGPPVRFWNEISESNNLVTFGWQNLFARMLDTPSFAPYVPPYYYGKSISRISFIPSETRKYTLDEIFENCTVENINENLDRVFRERSLLLITGTTNAAATRDNYSSSPAYLDRMPNSSSINLFIQASKQKITFDSITGKSTTAQEGENNNINPIWVIQTKFETPAINFANSDITNNIGLNFIGGRKESGYSEGVISSLFKGLWTTYSTQSAIQENGINFYIADSFTKETFRKRSLRRVCGFKKEDMKTIGEINENKTISEAVVLIPYTLKDKRYDSYDYANTIPEILGENGVYEKNQRGLGPYYFRVNKSTLEELLDTPWESPATNPDFYSSITTNYYETTKNILNTLKKPNNSIISNMKKMVEYYIPPHLDWISNRLIDPFVMYIFDFNTILNKQDLMDIWQGVMPSRSLNAELESTRISHPMDKNEFFHGKRLPTDIKFKAFKVKKRAGSDYQQMLKKTISDKKFNFNFATDQQAPIFSYNWPYDFFSLVELANIDVSLDYTGSVSGE